MGCGTSKAASVVANSTLEQQSSKMKKATSKNVENLSTNTMQENPPTSTEESSERDVQYGSYESLPSSGKITSAVSRQSSAKSKDSGLGGDTELEHATTEKSSPNVEISSRKHAENSIRIDTEKMKIQGSSERRKRNTIKLPPVKPKVKAAEDLELEVILQKRVKFADVLINELPTTNSIVKRPVSRGGVAFDIVMCGKENESEAPPTVEEIPSRLPPLCVRNYAKKQRLSDIVTKAELEEKQKAAEQRRKEIEQMRLERLLAQKEKDRQVAEALEKFAAMQSNLKNSLKIPDPPEDQAKVH